MFRVSLIKRCVCIELVQVYETCICEVKYEMFTPRSVSSGVRVTERSSATHRGDSATGKMALDSLLFCVDLKVKSQSSV